MGPYFTSWVAWRNVLNIVASGDKSDLLEANRSFLLLLLFLFNEDFKSGQLPELFLKAR